MYKYIQGRTGYGIGAEAMGFQQPTSLPVDSIYAARYNARLTMAPQAPGYLKEAQNFVPVSLLANGVYFSGDMALQALSEFEKGNGQ